MSERTYRFVDVTHCNMCGADAQQARSLGRRLDRRQGLWPRRLGGITTSVFACRDCGLVFPNPLPIPAEIAQHYAIDPDAYWGSSVFERDDGYLSDVIATYGRLAAGIAGPPTALDIGAGVGKGMHALGDAGFDVFGIEASPTFFAAAVERMGISADRLQLVALEDAEFPPDSFDFVHFGAVLEHLVDPASALTRAATWLRPGGLMHVEVPSSAFLLTRLVKLFYRLTLDNFSVNLSPMHPPYHLYEFSLDSFEIGGRSGGYGVAHHEFYPCAGYMPRVLVKPFDRVMAWTDTGMQLAVWLRGSE